MAIGEWQNPQSAVASRQSVESPIINQQSTMMPLSPRLLAIVGATATGKSALGIALARPLGGEVVSCDSTAVYRGFDIGTDKVPVAEQRGIPHHMVDVVGPTEEYSAARYAREAAAVIRDITSRGKLPILVGGTGLYSVSYTHLTLPKNR